MTHPTAMPPLYRACWLGLHAVFGLYFRWRVFNAGRVPREGPLILASSHASFMDPMAVGTSIPRMCHYLARATLFHNPLFAWLLRNVGTVPVDRDGGSAAGLRTILGRLEQGSAILLFPEGTRSPDGRLQRARAGIGLAVLKSGASVVPVRLFGNFEAWGRGRRLPRPRRLVVKFGRLMRFEPQLAEARSCSKDRLRELYHEVSDQIMAAIAALEPVKDREE